MGGQEPPEGAWPWQVSIQIKSSHHCGGTILNSLWVLTATHCFYKYLMHAKYKRVVGCVGGCDGCLTGLFENQVGSTGTISVRWQGIVCYLLLEIVPRPTQLLNRLQEAEVELIDRIACNLITWYNSLIIENMICAGLESTAVDSCQGDSGDPLQCYSEDEERFYAVGVTSFGEECRLPHRLRMYASRFARWLKTSQTASASAAHRLNTRLSSTLLSAALMLL